MLNLASGASAWQTTGLDKLQRQLEEAQQAFSTLDGEVATVSFDLQNPESIETAIRSVEATTDNKFASYRDNPMIACAVPRLKEKYRARFTKEPRALNGARLDTWLGLKNFDFVYSYII